MGRYDHYELTSDDADHGYLRNMLLRDVANELSRANDLKRIEIDLLAFQTGLTKEARKELKESMDEI